MDIPRSIQEDRAMVNRKWLSVALGIVLVGLSAPASMRAHASANDLDRTMYVTFNRPVALPGVALGSGTYIFELADPTGAWDIVRVSSQDRRMVYLTAFTRVVDRPRGMSPDQVISFAEAPANVAQPIKTWYPTGESTGREFIYR
jgi:hypothetical protein